MCDLFGMKCCVEGCENGMPIHITNFAVNRKVIKKVYCRDHIPERKGAVLFFRQYPTDFRETIIAFAVELDLEAFRRDVQTMNKEDIATLLTQQVIGVNDAEEYIIDFPYYEGDG